LEIISSAKRLRATQSINAAQVSIWQITKSCAGFCAGHTTWRSLACTDRRPGACCQRIIRGAACALLNAWEMAQTRLQTGNTYTTQEIAQNVFGKHAGQCSIEPTLAISNLDIPTPHCVLHALHSDHSTRLGSAGVVGDVVSVGVAGGGVAVSVGVTGGGGGTVGVSVGGGSGGATVVSGDGEGRGGVVGSGVGDGAGGTVVSGVGDAAGLSGAVVGDSTGEAAGDSIGEAAGDSIGEAAGDSTGGCVGDGAGDSTGDGAGDSTGDGAGNSVGGCVGDSTGDSVGSTTSVTVVVEVACRRAWQIRIGAGSCRISMKAKEDCYLEQQQRELKWHLILLPARQTILAHTVGDSVGDSEGTGGTSALH
jgi:hypothetical protein